MNVRTAVIEMLEDPTLPPEDREPRGPVDPSAVDRFEQEWGMSIPQAVREWLAVRNGAFIGYRLPLVSRPGVSGTSRPHFGTCRSGIHAAGSRWQRMATGDYYVAASESSPEPEGVIIFVDQMDFETPAYAVGSDMWHFLYGLASTELRSEDWWPFDEGTVLAVDPGLARHPSLPLPWRR
jgi:hypothetical protein